MLTLTMQRLLLLLGGVAAATADVGSPVFSSAVRTHVSVAEGKTALLNCTVHRARMYKVAWLDRARGVILSMEENVVTGNPRVSIMHIAGRGSSDSWLLSLRDVVVSDAGTYMCQLNTVPRLSKIFVLSVVRPPRILDSGSGGDVHVVEGDRAELRCSAEGTPTPTLTWRREDGELISTLEGTGPVTDDGRLIFTRTHRKHAGAYLCIANNGVPPPVSQRVQLSVAFGPEAAAQSRMEGAIMGQEANVSCVVTGWPKPSVYWTNRAGQRLDVHQRALDSISSGFIPEEDKQPQLVSGTSSINSTTDLAWLMVTVLSSTDLQHYHCFANSTLASANDSILIYEIPAPTTTTTTTTTITTPRGTSDSIMDQGMYHPYSEEYLLWRDGTNSSLSVSADKEDRPPQQSERATPDRTVSSTAIAGSRTNDRKYFQFSSGELVAAGDKLPALLAVMLSLLALQARFVPPSGPVRPLTPVHNTGIRSSSAPGSFAAGFCSTGIGPSKEFSGNDASRTSVLSQ
ncbi:protein amalgam [Hyalella azteca]|uniref:Protein amalgam n=1 Tax=Hyalella azteca TaxID=294128 RepID=A0A979FGS9_HYAAZ|nr:protein amalgam [Hyalella azteca]